MHCDTSLIFDLPDTGQSQFLRLWDELYWQMQPAISVATAKPPSHQVSANPDVKQLAISKPDPMM